MKTNTKIITSANNEIISNHTLITKLNNQTSQAVCHFFSKMQNTLGCTYVLYMYEDLINDRKIIFSTDWKWQNLLVGEKLINECPVFKFGNESMALGRKSILLPWNDIPCKTSIEKDITLLRAEFNIANGVGVAHSNGIVRESIGLGADISDYNFYQRALANNLIYAIMKDIRFLALAEVFNKTITLKRLH